ncbi:DUF937 domain-containing protein [Chryseolinea lacunae]|uniref:DUF937 domain-containing protein n=1 Tax=Chryseolinea lacunae TaxID=2801331 RepID=A0ABS1KXY4_9BACT|nr:DUF937 domain-containing protein [Chryseolinea lacunae]MBL0744102.1 hypothetical protein [Chryseolinea lacunae]
MLDQLIKLVEQNAGDAIVRNQAVPDKFNNAAIQDVAQQIFSGLQGQVGAGNFQQITSMFNGGAGSLSSNPMVTQIVSGIAGNLASKFGVSPQAAQSIAGSLIPQVMNQFVNKTNDPNDNDFDLQSMLQSFGGNSDLGSILGKVTGGSSSQGSGDLGGMLGKILG